MAPSFFSELRAICGDDGVITQEERLMVYECDAYTMEKHLPDAHVAHVVYYGDGAPEGFRLRVGKWLPAGKPTLYSPHLAAPVPLQPAPDGSLALPAFGQYCAVKF
jgi:hypothetical protein